MITLISLIFIILALLSLSIINITSDSNKFLSRFCYFFIVSINIFFPKINSENKMLINGIFSIISSIIISFVYAYFAKSLFDQKLFFAILIMIPSIFSTISMNFIDLSISVKRRFTLYISQSEVNIADTETKKENIKSLKKMISDSQRKNAIEL